MDIPRMSMALSQNSLKSAVSLSLMKMQMNVNSEMATGMKEMIDKVAVDTNIGQVIDKKA
ncbi:MAG: YjfB family protein [Clostridium sp.]